MRLKSFVQNTPGSYTCSCTSPYHGDGFTCQGTQIRIVCVDHTQFLSAERSELMTRVKEINPFLGAIFLTTRSAKYETPFRY